jgi:uncharacterized protein (TIRG00374 family)
MEIEQPVSSTKTIDRWHLLYLAVFAIAIFLLLPHLFRFDHLIQLLRTAKPEFIAIAVLAEMSRYFFSAGSTIALARLFNRRVALLPMTEAFIAGAALNRIFSTGGAPGMVLRLVFLIKQDIHAGWVAAIYMIEDIIGLGIGVLIFLFGIGTLMGAQNARTIIELAAGLVAGSIVLGALAIYILRRRVVIQRLVHYLFRESNCYVERFLHRTIYFPDRVQRTLDDFYTGMHAARLQPQYVVASLFFNLARYVAGGATLYLCFHALGDTISPGILIMLYTAASMISTTSAIPGEVAIMGTGFVVLFGSLGLSPEAAILALVLSRALAFWLPLPIGLLAFVHLRRKHGL